MTDVSLGESQYDDPEDLALGEDTSEVSDPVAEPEDFDFGAFVSGVRGTRRQVRITARGDLYAEMDQIFEQANDPDITEDEAGELLERVEEIKREIWDSQKVMVVEGRSDTRRQEIERKLAKPGKKASAAAHRAHAFNVLIAQLADAIVVPSNVSMADLERLYEVAPSELDKLYEAAIEASKGKGAMTPNFLQRR